jgi:transcriptional regulator with XRE-family HTH domain
MTLPPYDPAHPYWRRILIMTFPERLAAARHARKLSQAQIARATGINPSQIKRYETGLTQPSLEALRKLALALHVSADALLFEEGERGPDDEFKNFLEAISQFAPDEKATARAVLQGLILQHQARRWAAA